MTKSGLAAAIAVAICFVPVVIGVIGQRQQAAALEKGRQAANSSEDQVEQALLADPNKAVPELIRRVATRLNVGKGGRIFLIEEVSGVVLNLHGYSQAPAWRVSCGVSGIGLTLGWADAGTSNTLSLSSVPIDTQDCAKLLPNLADGVEAIFAKASKT